MSHRIFYRTLFKLRLLHHYHLDDGEVPFDDSPDLEKRQLQGYNLRQFIQVKPLMRTVQHIKNQRLLFKWVNDGFVILIRAKELNGASRSFRPLIALADDLQLDFALTATDPLFYNYSKLFSEQPLLVGNYRLPGLNGSFPLIPKTSTKTYAENYAVSNPAINIPQIFKYQANQELIGMVSMKIKGEDATKNLILTNGKLPQETASFTLRFQNKKTFWRYYKNSQKTPVFNTEPNLKPLVKQGIVQVANGGTTYPAAQPSSVAYQKDSNGKILKTFSETYIN
ncbi:MAG: hypothetical protein WBG71_14430 [Leeuwenhoekiella sp.]